MPVYSSPRCNSWHTAPADYPEPATDVRCSFAAGHPPNRHAAAGITWTDDEGRDLLAEIRESQPVTAKPTHTPIRNVRVPDELWAAATVRAAERGESVSDVVRRALARYARSSK